MSYFIQKAIDIVDVNRKKVPLINLDDYYVQKKYDGCHGLLTIEPDGTVYPRTSSGDEWKAITQKHIAAFVQKWRDLGKPGPYFTFCFEAWIPGAQHSEINGTFRRFEPQDSLYCMVFDAFEHDNKDVLESNEYYANRISRLGYHWKCGKVATATTIYAISLDFSWQMAKGWKADPFDEYDGAVLVHKNGLYKAGRCRAGEKIKLKPLLEFDLRVLRFNPAQGEKTGKITGSITVDFHGKELDVAVLREEDLRVLHADNNAWTGMIVAVEAMGQSSKGLLREPTLKGLRIDKKESDA